MGLADVDQLERGQTRAASSGSRRRPSTASSTAGSSGAVDWDAWERLGVLGLDEIALKRGHCDSSPWCQHPRRREASRSWRCSRTARRRRSRPSCVRSPSRCGAPSSAGLHGDVRGLRERGQRGNRVGEIAIDRFHVARARRDCADMVRKRELKRLKRALPRPRRRDHRGDVAVSQAAGYSSAGMGAARAGCSPTRRSSKRCTTCGQPRQTCSNGTTRRRGRSAPSGPGASGCVGVGWPTPRLSGDD